jgi:hypothetical protein
MTAVEKEDMKCMVRCSLSLSQESVDSTEFQSTGPSFCDNNMILESVKIIIYETGLYRAQMTLEDNSGHRKYSNMLSALVMQNESELCRVDLLESPFEANFSPGERKSYERTFRPNDCIKGNYSNLKNGNLTMAVEHICTHR